MRLVTIDEVRDHCNVAGTYDDLALTRAANGAEQAAEDFLNRRVFANAEDLQSAIAELPDVVESAEAAWATARAEAQALPGEAGRIAEMAACSQWEAAAQRARETAVGMVVNSAIRDAVLLIAGHLYRNRENVITGTIVTEMKEGAYSLLWPHRCGLGV